MGLLFIAIIFHLGFYVDQKDFNWVLADYSLLFALYMLLVKMDQFKWVNLIGLALMCRGLLIFTTPNLSDDIYRFLWDGYLTAQGISPLEYLPSYLMENKVLESTYLKELYPMLNSPDYYTVYPPLAQVTFVLASVFAKSLVGQIIWIKIILFVFEIGNIWVILKILRVLRLPERNVMWYALNPLVMIEVMGNVHYEGVLLFFLLVSIFLSLNRQFIASGIAMASSIASKLTSAMYLPLWIKYLGLRKVFWFYLIIGVTVIAFFAPFVSTRFIQNFGDSINLYFQKFEFNASIYYLVRWVGFQFRGYNMIADIGPWLSLATISAIALLSYKQRVGDTRQLFEHIMIVVTVYLLGATTVHPWYIIIPCAFSLFTRWNYPILWSYVAIWSYSHYDMGVIGEKFGWLWAEYIALLGIMIWELLINYRRNRNHSDRLSQLDSIQ